LQPALVVSELVADGLGEDEWRDKTASGLEQNDTPVGRGV
jgi:hypothetical protein